MDRNRKKSRPRLQIHSIFLDDECMKTWS